MMLRCRVKFHRWGKWQSVPMTNSGSSNGWLAGQLRQCADCYLMQIVKAGDGVAFNYRPLRDAIGVHIRNLRRYVETLSTAEHADMVQGTVTEMQKAVESLTQELNNDLAIPQAPETKRLNKPE